MAENGRKTRAATGEPLKHFEKLDPVSKRVVNVNSSDLWQIHIVAEINSPPREVLHNLLKRRDLKRRMRLLGGRERFFDAQMNVYTRTIEPDSAAPLQDSGLFNLFKAKCRCVEIPGVILLAARHGQLNVVYIRYHRGETYLCRCKAV